MHNDAPTELPLEAVLRRSNGSRLELTLYSEREELEAIDGEAPAGLYTALDVWDAIALDRAVRWLRARKLPEPPLLAPHQFPKEGTAWRN